LIYEEFKNHKLRFLIGFNYITSRAKATQNFGPGILDLTQPTISGALSSSTDTAAIYITDAERAVVYTGIQDEYKINEKLELTLGLRYDYYNDVGSTLNPRVALVWSARDDLTAKLIYGRAFRAPSFAELYNKNNPVALGSEDVKPEIIDSTELSLEHQSSSNWHNSLSLYRYKITEYIRFNPKSLGSTVLEAQNTGEQTGYGLEYQTDYKINKDFSLLANYAYVHAKDENGKIEGLASHQAYAQINWNVIPRLKFNNQLFYIGSKERGIADIRDKTPSYTIVNSTLRYTFKEKNADIALSIYNLFDKQYVMPAPAGTIAGDYPMSGRSFSVQLQYRF